MRFNNRLSKPPTGSLRPIISDNACDPRITAAAGTELAVAFCLDTVMYSFLSKGVYNPRTFILHAVLLRQACAHCGKFLTAAHRSGLDRVSVPVWLIILSNQLLIVALVSLYLTNKLIRRELFRRQIALFYQKVYGTLAPVSRCYFPPAGKFSRVTHPSATRVKTLVRLACVKHTASVHPEPGSNSHVVYRIVKDFCYFAITVLSSCQLY